MPISVTKEEIINQLFNIFSKITGEENINAFTEISPQQKESLIVIDIMVEIEMQFGVSLQPYDDTKFKTLGEIVDHVLPKIQNG